jgi:hypothetical protein
MAKPSIDPLLTLARLRELGDKKVGDPMPDWMVAEPNDWGTPLSALCRDAVDLIENLVTVSNIARAVGDAGSGA